MSPLDLRLYFLLLLYLASGFQLSLIFPGTVLILSLKTAHRDPEERGGSLLAGWHVQ